VILAAVETLVRDRIGLDPASLGTSTLSRVVENRLQARGLVSVEAYAGLVSTDADEWAALMAELVVPETWFFRGGWGLFQSLAAWVRDRIAVNGSNRPVRVLSVPCSTGEEPFSLAIALAEENVPAVGWHIDAVDVCPDQVARATTSRYSAFAFREPIPDLRAKYFLPIGDTRWELVSRVRKRVKFRVGNLVQPDFLAGERAYDLVICRNLFIYLTDEARVKAMANLDRLLLADGVLCFTPAEADRLPTGRFVPLGPVNRAVFRRATNPAVAPRTETGGSPPTIAAPGSRSGAQRSPGPRAVVPPVGVVPASLIAVSAVVPEAPDPVHEVRDLANAGRLEEARMVCHRGLLGRPTAELYSLLGVIHLAAGRQDDAGEAFRKALYLDPEHREALTHTMVLSEHLGDLALADGLRRRLARLDREVGS